MVSTSARRPARRGRLLKPDHAPPPSIHRRAAPAQSTPPGPLSQRWANLPPETRRRLSQILARVIARHRLPHNRKEVPDD
jgi:hypothetical protein